MTAFNIDRFTTSGAPDVAFGTRGEITTTFPQTTLGATATTCGDRRASQPSVRADR